MKRFLIILAAIIFGCAVDILLPSFDPLNSTEQLYPPTARSPEENPVQAFEGEPDDENELKNCQVPIPMKDRVYNKTGSQCVWASLECLGRYADCQPLIGLTDQPGCKGTSSPGSANAKLQQLRVRFVTTTNKADRSLILLAVVKERRGVLFGIPGHAMNLIHYDQQNGIVKYINNSDHALKVRTWTMDEFNRHFDGWVTAIYADPDIIPQKYLLVPLLPIIDRTGPQGVYPPEYFLMPRQN